MTSEKRAGLMLVVTGIAAIALMMAHPSGSDSAMMISGMHGSILVVMLVQAAALLFLLGGRELRELSATIFYVAGVAATLMAGLLNGFLFPAMRAYGDEVGHDIFDLIWAGNQMLAQAGVIGVGIGFALWSVGLWDKGERVLAGFGLVAGLLPGALLITGIVEMDLHGALGVYALQALWVIALGWTRWRGGSASA